jgi:hypothetical protein
MSSTAGSSLEINGSSRAHSTSSNSAADAALSFGTVYRWYPLSPSRCSPLPPTNAYSP